MRRVFVPACLIAMAFVGLGCSQNQPLAPSGSLRTGEATLDATPAGIVAPPQYFATYWTARGMSMETIDVVHGVGVPYLEDVLLDDPSGKGYSAALGMTFDLDGTAYIINNWVWGSNPNLAELDKIDMKTGAVTVIAQINNHFCGSEIDARGNLYTVGFQPPPPNDGVYFSPLYGDKLCRIDKYTGAVTPIGSGTGLPDVMDVAFDSKGTLWATTQNKLYTLNLETGVATFVADITNVPPAPPGETNPMMIMSIAFDKNDVLYGTAMVGFAVTSTMVSPIMRINQQTGEGTVLGYSELGYNHGGDTMPTRVKILHQADNHKMVPMEISLDALPMHRAHGDVVPGCNGVPFDLVARREFGND